LRPLLLFIAVLAGLLAALAATPLLVALPHRTGTPVPGEFNEIRAKARLAAVLGDQRPHPADSAAGDSVRERLVQQLRSMGLEPVVRDQFACNQVYKQRGVTCGRVRNVIVALGPQAGKALLLNAHYDSTPAGPGAGDDGIGVATLLEVGSILKDEPLRRPTILLFNEGEELGLVGARAFMADPLSRNVDSLVNLEARGTTGPVTTFETSLPNGSPVRAFARAVDRPFANSLATDFYRQLPNYTDVNSFSERGWLTLNLAMIGNEARYHSPGDNLAALDVRSLRHMGEQTLALARGLQQAPSGGGNLLFADVAGRQLVAIPQWLGVGLLGLLAAVFAFLSIQRGGSVRGLLVVLAALLASAALAFLCIQAMALVRAGTFWRGGPAWTHLAIYACGLAGPVAALGLIGRTLDVPRLRAASWLGFVLLGVAILFVAPGGIIYFLFPPLAALIGIVAKQERIGAIVAALLLWLSLGEVLALLRELLNNGPLFVFGLLAALIALPWLVEIKPLLDRAGRARATAAAGAFVLLAWAIVAITPAYSADRQQRFTIQHVTDEVHGHAYWTVIDDGAPPPSNYGGVADWRRAELPNVEKKRWIASAPPVPGLRPPQIEPISNVRDGALRTVTYRIRPNGAESVEVVGPEDSAIVSAGSGAFVRPIASGLKGRYRIECYGRSCDGAIMQFTTRARAPIAFTLIGSRSGLPPSAKPLLEQRPQFARAQYLPDSTVTLSRVAL
jgi:hypothetical protein